MCRRYYPCCCKLQTFEVNFIYSSTSLQFMLSVVEAHTSRDIFSSSFLIFKHTMAGEELILSKCITPNNMWHNLQNQ